MMPVQMHLFANDSFLSRWISSGGMVMSFWWLSLFYTLWHSGAVVARWIPFPPLVKLVFAKTDRTIRNKNDWTGNFLSTTINWMSWFGHKVAAMRKFIPTIPWLIRRSVSYCGSIFRIHIPIYIYRSKKTITTSQVVKRCIHPVQHQRIEAIQPYYSVPLYFPHIVRTPSWYLPVGRLESLWLFGEPDNDKIDHGKKCRRKIENLCVRTNCLTFGKAKFCSCWKMIMLVKTV